MEQPNASIAAIDYPSDRKFNRDLINWLAICDYISDYRKFFTAIQEAVKRILQVHLNWLIVKKYYTIKFVRMPNMFHELHKDRDNANFSRVLTKYTKLVLLIIDEWLLIKLNEHEVRNVFAEISKRRESSYTILCSQYFEEVWHNLLGGEGTLTGDVMDRISYDLCKINITSIASSEDISKREVQGLISADAQ